MCCLATETVLKGKETALPEGAFYHDKEGTRRTVMRTCWWGDVGTYNEFYMGPEEARANIPRLPMPEDALGQYADDAPPVFIGHYWLDGTPSPLAHILFVSIIQWRGPVGALSLIDPMVSQLFVLRILCL